jgi:hypothetical protein
VKSIHNCTAGCGKIIPYKMIRSKSQMLVLVMFSVIIFLFTWSGCKKDDSASKSSTSYDLKSKDVLGVTGKVTFIETSATSATIEIALNNAPSGTHPAGLYMYSEVENGASVIALNSVDESGKSSTVVTNMTYGQLIGYDGNIKVMKSSSEPAVILAQGDIGGNVLTTVNKTYTLDTIGALGVSGTALFEKRVNGNTLVTLSLTGTINGDVYPATINLGSITSIGGGPVVKILSSVPGTEGKSFTNIRQLDSDINITYDNWLVYVGYINVYQISVDPVNIISHGNIGTN